ncbi:unnamed protein product [Brassica napus]|uniref:(rape) hypothetical protein n=1 Tax=Brassica napus TaxID=3708 RepID=A0A816NPX7_BRANA|nr:unnamed protein product [Brassica napus]
MEVAALRSMETQRQWTCSATETLLFLVGRNLACLLLAAESLLIGLIAEDQRLSVKEGYKKGHRDEENKDASDSDDDDDDDEDNTMMMMMMMLMMKIFQGVKERKLIRRMTR